MNANSKAATPEQILDIALGFRKSKVLLTAVELGVFDALANASLDADALVRQLGLHGRGARDFFDALVALSFLERDSSGRYANTPDCVEYLDRGKPAYLGGLLEYLNARIYPSWDRLAPALRTGTPQGGPFEVGGFDEYYADNSSLDIFLAGMTGGSTLPAKALATEHSWAEYRTVIDIGTAQGCVPVEIARTHPHLSGGGFDLPALEPEFNDYVVQRGIGDRLKFYRGDFLKDPLPSADVLIMGRILHDWDLATRKSLLHKAFRALPADGALIVWESFIDETRRCAIHGLLSSINMLIQTSAGFECTVSECVGWMEQTGFVDVRAKRLTGPYTAIVGKKTHGTACSDLRIRS